MILDLKNHFVPQGPLAILEAFLLLLDYPRSALVNKQGEAAWKNIRSHLDDDLFRKLQEFDPKAEPDIAKIDKYKKVKYLLKLLSGIRYEDVKRINYPLAVILRFVLVAIELRKEARAERAAVEKKLREEKEQRERAEAEKKREEEEAKRQQSKEENEEASEPEDE